MGCSETEDATKSYVAYGRRGDAYLYAARPAHAVLDSTPYVRVIKREYVSLEPPSKAAT